MWNTSSSNGVPSSTVGAIVGGLFGGLIPLAGFTVWWIRRKKVKTSNSQFIDPPISSFSNTDDDRSFNGDRHASVGPSVPAGPVPRSIEFSLNAGALGPLGSGVLQSIDKKAPTPLENLDELGNKTHETRIRTPEIGTLTLEEVEGIEALGHAAHSFLGLREKITFSDSKYAWTTAGNPDITHECFIASGSFGEVYKVTHFRKSGTL